MASIESGELTFVDGTNSGTEVQLIALADGKSLMVYIGGTPTGGSEVFGRVLDAQGVQVGLAFQLSQSSPYTVAGFDTARIDDGHIAIVFNTMENAVTSAAIRAAVFDPIALSSAGGTIPTSFSVADSHGAITKADVEVIGGDLAFVWSKTNQAGQSVTYGTVLDAVTRDVVTSEKALFDGNVSNFQDLASLGQGLALTGSNQNSSFMRFFDENLNIVDGGRFSLSDSSNRTFYGTPKPFGGDYVFGFESRALSTGNRHFTLEVGGNETVGSWTPTTPADAPIVPYVVGDKIVAVYGHRAQVLSYEISYENELDLKQYIFSTSGPEFTIDSNTYPDDIVVHGDGFLAVWREDNKDIVGQFFTATGSDTGILTRGDSDEGVGVDAGGTDTFTGNVLDNDVPNAVGGAQVVQVNGKPVGTTATAIVGTYGTLTISANGQYSYKADRPAAIALTKDQAVQEFFTYRAKSGNDDDTAQLSINVQGVFDGGARSVALTSNKIAENRASGSEVGRVTAQGEEAFTYALVNNTGKPFKIGSTGIITTTKPLDREASASYSVTVKVTGQESGLATTKTFAIGVTDVNEAPSKPTFTSAYKKDGFGFYELSTKSTGTFGKLAAIDPERGAVTYVATVKAFNGGAYSNSTKFKVVGNELRVNGALADDFYYISVSARDSAGNLSPVSTISIDVDVPNSAPVIAGAASASVDAFENSKTVTTIKATDKDAHTTLTYSLSGGADKALFDINANSGVLTFKTAPNFEAPKDSGKNNVYNVIVKVTDGTASDTQALAVKVKDVGGPAKAMPPSHGDTFVFEKGDAGTAPGSWARIADFTRGEDRIDLSGIDADPARGDQALRFVDHFTTAKAGQPDGQVRVVDHGKHVKVEVDYNGDAQADMIVHVLNVAKLTAGDFIL